MDGRITGKGRRDRCTQNAAQKNDHRSGICFFSGFGTDKNFAKKMDHCIIQRCWKRQRVIIIVLHAIVGRLTNNFADISATHILRNWKNYEPLRT
jgi:hypothetical protein